MRQWFRSEYRKKPNNNVSEEARSMDVLIGKKEQHELVLAEIFLLILLFWKVLSNLQ